MEDSKIPDVLIFVDAAKIKEDIDSCALSMQVMEQGQPNGIGIKEMPLYLSLASRQITLEQILEGAYS